MGMVVAGGPSEEMDHFLTGARNRLSVDLAP